MDALAEDREVAFVVGLEVHGVLGLALRHVLHAQEQLLVGALDALVVLATAVLPLVMRELLKERGT